MKQIEIDLLNELQFLFYDSNIIISEHNMYKYLVKLLNIDSDKFKGRFKRGVDTTQYKEEGRPGTITLAGLLRSASVPKRQHNVRLLSDNKKRRETVRKTNTTYRTDERPKAKTKRSH